MNNQVINPKHIPVVVEAVVAAVAATAVVIVVAVVVVVVHVQGRRKLAEKR